jgi:hypothetical protein
MKKDCRDYRVTPPPIYFVHIMKTGGSAMGEYLRPQYDPRACYPPRKDPNFTRKKINVQSILNLSSRQRARIRFYTLHMPAWVAAKVAPGHLHVAVMREPVARTVSHLKHIARGCNIDSLEEIYDDPRWRNRLSNYQTRVFGLQPSDHRTRWEVTLGVLRVLLSRGARSDIEPLPPGRNIGDYWLFTAMENDRSMEEADLERAIAMVDSFDLVGVTEKLGEFQAALEALTGTRGDVEQVNVAPQSPELPDTLMDRIRQDNHLDTRLYNHVLSRWC